jgi:hypothetical protein
MEESNDGLIGGPALEFVWRAGGKRRYPVAQLSCSKKMDLFYRVVTQNYPVTEDSRYSSVCRYSQFESCADAANIPSLRYLKNRKTYAEFKTRLSFFSATFSLR